MICKLMDVIVLINGLSFSTGDIYQKKLLFKGRDPKAIPRAYLKSLKEACDTLNKGLSELKNMITDNI